jgi:hypothetical protein
LLQYGVQAAPPIRDTGNDLIAIKQQVFKAVQVKTTRTGGFDFSDLNNRIYHLLALVYLEDDDKEVYLDKSRIYLLKKEEFYGASSCSVDALKDKEISEERILELFSNQS